MGDFFDPDGELWFGCPVERYKYTLIYLFTYLFVCAYGNIIEVIIWNNDPNGNSARNYPTW